MKMSTRTSAEGDQDNARFTACLDKPRHSFPNDVDDNPDLFLAASLQFLHRLLAERTLQYARVDTGSIPNTRRNVEDMQERGNNPGRQLHFQQIDEIEEYKRQLRNMEDFLYNIQGDTASTPMRDTADCDAIALKQTKNIRRGGDQRNFEFKTLNDDLYDFVSRDATPLTSAYPYSSSNYDDLSAVEGPATVSLTLRKSTSDAASDFAGCLEANSVFPTSSGPANAIQSTASYVDLLRNAVSGLARKCKRRHRSRNKKYVAKSWLPRAGSMEVSQDEGRREECQSEVKSEMSSKWQLHDGRDLDISKEIPLRVQLATETDASPREPVTLLVKVPNTVFNLLNRKVSNRDRTIMSTDRLMEARIEPGKRKKRITSVFRNLLKGRKTPSSTTVYTTKEKFSSSVTLTLEETGFSKKDSVNDTSRNSLIYTLQESAACESFDRKRSAEISCETNNAATIKSRNTECTSVKCMFVPPTKNVNRGYERISLNISPRVISCEAEPWNGKAVSSTRQNLDYDKALRTEAPSNKAQILNSLANYCDEKIIPLRCSEGSPQIGKIRGEISHRDVDTFLKLAAEIRKTQVYRGVNDKHLEIPVEIKTMKTPLHLRKIHSVPRSSLDYCVFHPVSKGSQDIPNGLERQDFLEMLVGTCPEGDYRPQTEYSKLKQLPTASDLLENESRDSSRLLKNSENSALEVLLRHIATDPSTTSSVKQYAAEKDTTVQTTPKRQLSKISVCYSSESLSGSDHENPELRIENSAYSQDEYRAYNRVLSEDSRKSVGNRQYLRHYENAEQNCADDHVVFHDEREGRYTGAKIRSSTGYHEIAENGNSNQNSNPVGIQAERNLVPCSRTEIIIEEQNCSTVEAEVNAQVFMDRERTPLSIRETEKSLFCHPVLSRQIRGDQKELADAMIRWWGPQINYSTTPSSQTQLSGYSVSNNNWM